MQTNVAVKVGGEDDHQAGLQSAPLLYFLSGMVAGGEAISLLKEKAFGIERKDALQSSMSCGN
jgi:hypothetical protein